MITAMTPMIAMTSTPFRNLFIADQFQTQDKIMKLLKSNILLEYRLLKCC
jgi:hypothetical protein